MRCPNCGNAIRGVVGPGPAVQVRCEHCKWWFDPKLPKNERPEAPITVAALEPGALALFIVRWLRERNNGELFATFAEMKVGNYECGGALDQLLSGGASARSRRRIDEFILALQEGLLGVEKRLYDEDAMSDLLTLVLTRVASTRSADKRWRFLNIVVNQAVGGTTIDDAEAAVDLLERLTDLDVAVLTAALTEPNVHLPNGVLAICLQRRRRPLTEPPLSERFPGVPQEQLVLACAKLTANGLLVDEGVGRLDCGALEYFVATDLARWFANWIRQEAA